jgi:tRNA/rRNA methyltransferase
MTIPMHAAGVSMNLGQAVAVTRYELARTSAPQRALPADVLPADGQALERFEALLREVLVASEYNERFPGNMGDDALRRLVRRLGLATEDAPIWLGMLRQVLWKLKR